MARSSVRRWWVGIGAAAVPILLLVGGYIMWDRNWRHASSANPGTVCPQVVPAGGRRPLSAIGVHKVLLIGDSIMEQASCSVAESLAGIGITTSRQAVSGSGLVSGSVDWLAKTRELVAAEKPDAVVAVFVGNKGPPPMPGVDPAILKADTPAFFTTWQQRAAALSKEVHDLGAQMYWVSPPPIAAGGLSHARRLFDGYQTIPGDHVLNAGASLAGPGNTETLTKKTCGQVRVVRSPDGIHLTDDGARIYGQAIAHELSADVGLLTTPKPC